MLDLGTLRGLHEHRHELAAYCPRCRRWAVLDLAAMVKAGHGDMPVMRLTPRCRRCGEPGEKQVRPPAPAFAGYGKYGPVLR